MDVLFLETECNKRSNEKRRIFLVLKEIRNWVQTIASPKITTLHEIEV